MSFSCIWSQILSMSKASFFLSLLNFFWYDTTNMYQKSLRILIHIIQLQLNFFFLYGYKKVRIEFIASGFEYVPTNFSSNMLLLYFIPPPHKKIMRKWSLILQCSKTLFFFIYNNNGVDIFYLILEMKMAWVRETLGFGFKLRAALKLVHNFDI